MERGCRKIAVHLLIAALVIPFVPRRVHADTSVGGYAYSVRAVADVNAVGILTINVNSTVNLVTLPPSGETQIIRPDLSQDGRLDGMPFGTRGGIKLHRYFPVDATYTIRFQAFTGVGISEEEPNFIEVAVDGQRVFYEEMKQKPIRHTMTGAENVEKLPAGYLRQRRRIYNDRIVNVFEDGWVIQYTLNGVALNGHAGGLWVCIVAKCRDGQITRIDEYLDSGKFPAWRGEPTAA